MFHCRLLRSFSILMIYKYEWSWLNSSYILLSSCTLHHHHLLSSFSHCLYSRLSFCANTTPFANFCDSTKGAIFNMTGEITVLKFNTPFILLYFLVFLLLFLLKFSIFILLSVSVSYVLTCTPLWKCKIHYNRDNLDPKSTLWHTSIYHFWGSTHCKKYVARILPTSFRKSCIHIRTARNHVHLPWNIKNFLVYHALIQRIHTFSI